MFSCGVKFYVDPGSLAGMDDDLLAAQGGDDRRRRSVEVPDIVRYGLVVPLGLAAGSIDSNDGVGVEVVTGTNAPIEVGGRVTHRDEDGVRRLIVSRGGPDAAAAPLPRIGILGAVRLFLGNVAVQVVLFGLGRPGSPPAVRRLLIEGLIPLGSRNRVPAPDLVAAHGVVRRDVAPNAVLAAGHANDHVVADDQRRMGDAVTRGGISHFLVPEDLPILGVEGHQVRVQCAHVEVSAAVDAKAPVIRTTAVDGGAQLVLVSPELFTGVQIVRHRGVVRSGHIHHPLGHQRRVLKRPKLGDAGLEDHPGHQSSDVCRGNGLQG
jgi:hypothetical protein